MNVLVFNILLWFFFLQYGPIVDIDLKMPPRPPGYAFVEVSTLLSQQTLINAVFLALVSCWISVDRAYLFRCWVGLFLCPV